MTRRQGFVRLVSLELIKQIRQVAVKVVVRRITLQVIRHISIMVSIRIALQGIVIVKLILVLIEQLYILRKHECLWKK